MSIWAEEPTDEAAALRKDNAGLRAEVERLREQLAGNSRLKFRLARLLKGLNGIGKQPHESWGASEDYKLGWHDVREMVEANIKEAQS